MITEVKDPGIPLIYTKNNNGTRMKSWGTSTSVWDMFEDYPLRTNLWRRIHRIFHIFPNALVYTSNLHNKLYQKLLISQGKLSSLLIMYLHQKLYKHHELLKVTDASKKHPGENQNDYCLVEY